MNNYSQSDWLGSTRFSSYTNRTRKWDLAHAPYGEVYALVGGGAEFTFTGQFSDYGSTNTLWDFPMREYHSSQGRWISPDPAGLAAVNLTNPQTWNRYAYVGGNPLVFVDPLGLGPIMYSDVGGMFTLSTDVVLNDVGAPGVNLSDDGGGDIIVGSGSGCVQCNKSLTVRQDIGDTTQWRKAAHNGPQSQANNKPSFWSCTFSAGTGTALATTALDAIGIIPGGGNVLHGVQLAAGGGALALSLGRASFNEAAVGGATTGLAFADAAHETENIAIHGVEVVPIAGNVVSAIATANDIFGKEGVIAFYKVCFSGGH